MDVNGSRYCPFVDECGGRGFIPLCTQDIDVPKWEAPVGYDLPVSPRHGTVLPVTRAELAALGAGLSDGSAGWVRGIGSCC